MSIRTVVMPLKAALLFILLFVSNTNFVAVILLLVLILALLPKIKSVIELTIYSGYMRSPDGKIYIVPRELNSKALASGLKEITIWRTATISGEIPVWKE
jgi:hypothetical protein